MVLFPPPPPPHVKTWSNALLNLEKKLGKNSPNHWEPCIKNNNNTNSRCVYNILLGVSTNYLFRFSILSCVLCLCRTQCGSMRRDWMVVKAWCRPTMYRDEEKSNYMPCRKSSSAHNQSPIY